MRNDQRAAVVQQARTTLGISVGELPADQEQQRQKIVSLADKLRDASRDLRKATEDAKTVPDGGTDILRSLWNDSVEWTFPYFDPPLLLPLVPLLIYKAVWGREVDYGDYLHQLFQLPRPQTVEIVKVLTPLLGEGANYNSWMRLLGCWEGLDRAVAYDVARQAAESSDPDVREAGEDFLKDPGVTSNDDGPG